MTDRPESTADTQATPPEEDHRLPPTPPEYPSHWEEWPTFRETFLLHLPPDLHPGVREAGRGIFATALELELPPLAQPWTHMRLRAVAADLRFLQQFLEAVAADRFEASLEEEEARLAERAEAWALKLHQIAARMEAATRKKPN